MAVLLISSVLVTGCAKKGCTDSNSTTFSASAKEDDGTCRYEGSLVFWLHDSTAQKMTNASIQNLTVYLDGDIVGSISTTDFFTSVPTCDAQGAVTVTKDLFSAKSKAFSYRILDNNGVKRRAGTIEFTGNACKSFEIIYNP